MSEKYYDNLGRMQSRVSNMNKRTRKGRVVLKQVKVRRDDMKVITKGLVAHACVQQVEVDGLKKSLEEAQSALEGMKVRVT